MQTPVIKFSATCFLVLALGLCFVNFANAANTKSKSDSTSLLKTVSHCGTISNSSTVATLGMFSLVANTPFDTKLTDSWTSNWVDYDNDGYDDLFVPERNINKGSYLYHNNKNGTFTAITSGDIVTDKGISTVATFADVDNDGLIDGLVVNDTRTSNFYYKNNGTSFIRDKTKPFASGDDISYYHNASWVDFDKDGKLDLFLCNYFSSRFNELYHNDGNGNFSKVTGGDITLDQSDAVGATWADYDNDGFQDLFIPSHNPARMNALYHNDGNNHFTKVTTGIVVNEGGYSVGSCWGDYNNDGLLDLFVSNTTGVPNYLYKNLGNGNFQKITVGAIVTNASASHGCSFADIDNDGDLDIFVTADTITNFLYINNGNGTFTSNTTENIVTLKANSFGHSWADYDHDGYLDLFISTYGNQRNYLFHNNGNSNYNWVNIKLIGTTSNKSAIGARVRVKANGKWQIREVNCQSGLGGQSSLNQHFGLNTASKIDSIQIIWPSGYVQVLTNQSCNKFLNITEDKGVQLKGIVYYDANNNNKLDATESVIPNQTILIKPGNIKVVTDNNGLYNVYLTKGNKTITFANNSNWSCCNNNININVTSLSMVLSNINFAAKTNCSNPDLSIDGGTPAMRKGFKGNYNLMIYNNGGANSTNYTVKFTVPTNQISILKATPNYSSITTLGNQKTYIWNVANGINIGGNFGINIIDSVSKLANLNDSVFTKAEVVYGTECNKSNNTFNDKNIIVGSFDPNMMVVSPAGEGTEGFVKADATLTYKIMFQNLGTDSASFINIIDTLPENIDLSTFQFKSSSHPCTYTLGDDRILQIRFDNINLPFATADEIGSNGYFSFNANPASTIEGGSTIVNQSSITFDYNDAVNTNKVINTIYNYNANVVNKEIFIYPNPAINVTNLVVPDNSFDQATQATIAVYSIAGNIVAQYNWDNISSTHYQLPINNLATGLYQIVVVADNKQQFTNKLQVVQQ